MTRYTFILAAAALLPTLCAAQSQAKHLNETLSAEGEFLPIVRAQERIAATPLHAEPSLPASPLTYDRRGRTVEFAALPDSIDAPGWMASRSTKLNRGYLTAGLGSYLNSTLSAGYHFNPTENLTLGAWLQHNSTSDFLPKGEFASRRKRLDETLNIYASAATGSLGNLDAELCWHSGYFNYYSNTSDFAPSQTLYDFTAAARWTMRPVETGWSTTAALSYRHFGYRRLMLPPSATSPSMRPPQENHLHLDALEAYSFSSDASAGLDMTADLLLYSRLSNSCDQNISFRPLNNYGAMSLTPYYSLRESHFSLRTAARIDLAFNAGGGFSAFHIAPDIHAGYTRGHFTAALRLGGGTQLNTLAALSKLDYYQSPLLHSTRPMFSPLDADLSVTLGNFGGFSAGVNFAYKITRGTPLGGLFPYIDTTGGSLDIRGISAGLHASLTVANLLEANARASYQPQNGRTGFFNGYDRPRWTIDSRIAVTPWRTLRVEAEYLYRGVRTLYTGPATKRVGAEQASGWTVPSLRLPDATILNLKASYAFTPRYSAWIEATNILSADYALQPAMPSEGIAIAVGLGIIF